MITTCQNRKIAFKKLLACTLFSLSALGITTMVHAESTSDTLKEAALNGIYLGSDYCDLDGGNRDIARCYYLGYDKGDGQYKIIVSQIWNNDGLLNSGHGNKLISPSVGINNSNSLSASQVLTKDQLKLFGFGGSSVLDNLADGKYTQKEKTTDSSGNETYKVNVIANGQISQNDTGLITGGTVYAVTNKLSDSLSTQTIKLNSATKRISSLSSTISDLKDSIIDINTSVTSAIISSNATINGRLDTNLSNLTTDGKDTLRQYIRDEIKNVAQENINKTSYTTLEMSKVAATPTSDFLADKANQSDRDDLSKVVDSKANQSDVNAALDKKADKDSVYSKEEVDNKFSDVSSKLDNKVDKSDFNTVKSQVDKNTENISKKADQAYVDSELSKKANLSDFNQLKDTVTSNTDKIATNTKDIESLKETKADIDGSNIDVSKFTEKLGVGKIEKDNTGLVTGGVVADALAYKADYGYVNAGFNALEGQMQQMNQNLTKNINQVGAGAAALAGLHPQDYDPDNKLDFAAGYGHYKNANATALGIYYRPNAGTTISLAGTLGNGAPMLSAGVSFKIGYGKNVEKVIVSKKEYDELNNKVEKLTELVLQMQAAQK